MINENYLSWALTASSRVLVAGYFSIGPDRFEIKYKNTFHAIHLYTYEATMKMDGKAFKIRPGDITISPKGCETCYSLDRKSYHWCIHFTSEDKSQVASEIKLPLHISAGAKTGEVTECFRRAIHWKYDTEIYKGTPLREALAGSALQELLLLTGSLSEEIEEHPDNSRGEKAMRHLCSILAERLTMEKSVDEWAETVGLSANYLAKLFRERLGTTVARYQLRCRIERAQALLETTELPVKVIGAQVGYPDPQHFNKRFRALTGTSPTRYRTQKTSGSPPPRRAEG